MEESIRGPMNPIWRLRNEEMSSECMHPVVLSNRSALELSYENLMPCHRMPFLQMLQGAMQAGIPEHDQEEEDGEEYLDPQPESHLQLLLRLQRDQLHHQDEEEAKKAKWAAEMDSSQAGEQLESCITTTTNNTTSTANPSANKARERRKRKRTRPPARSAEEAESQRMTHIAVERNRRRLMNDHLAALRSLMPPSYVHRGDQASIVAGAIDFVKELEQLLLSLQAEKRMRATICTAPASSPTTISPSRSNADEALCHSEERPQVHGFFVSPQYKSYTESRRQGGGGEGVDVEATVVQGHVNLKIAGRRRMGQLAGAVAALEELGLSVLHLNITSLDAASVLFSLNLKMEVECKLGTADEIATAAHQIFACINGS